MSNYGTIIDPVLINKTISSGTGYTNPDNVITFSNVCTFLQISNRGNSTLKVYLNGITTGYFSLGSNETQVFNTTDVHISAVAFDNGMSGSATTTVEVIAGVPR